MTEKRYKSIGTNLECPNGMEYMLIKRNDGFNVCQVCSKYTAREIVYELNRLADGNEQLQDALKQRTEQCDKYYEENEKLKKGMIGVVDRYIKNVDCNPPSSAHTYMKIKGALLNVREDLRDLLEDLE